MTDRSASKPDPFRIGGTRIGIFGGTFNPIHECHVSVAERCRTTLELDRIRFIPAGSPPLKKTGLAPAADRLAMVRLATRDNPAFDVDDIEVKREGRSFTADTLRALKATYPAVNWTLILGLDALLGMAAWHQPDQVLRLTPIAVLYRPGARFNDLTAMPLLSGVDFSTLAPSSNETAVPNHPIEAKGNGIHLTLLPILPCPVSATEIRTAIRAGTMPIPGLSPAVANYIIEHHLYV